MPSSIDLWNSRFPDMFDITKSEPGYDYMDGIPAAQFPGIRQRNYGEDYQYGEPPQLQRRAEQLGTFKGSAPKFEPEIRFKPKTQEEYDKVPMGQWYQDPDGEIYQKGGGEVT